MRSPRPAWVSRCSERPVTCSREVWRVSLPWRFFWLLPPVFSFASPATSWMGWSPWKAGSREKREICSTRRRTVSKTSPSSSAPARPRAISALGWMACHGLRAYGLRARARGSGGPAAGFLRPLRQAAADVFPHPRHGGRRVLPARSALDAVAHRVRRFSHGGPPCGAGCTAPCHDWRFHRAAGPPAHRGRSPLAGVRAGVAAAPLFCQSLQQPRLRAPLGGSPGADPPHRPPRGGARLLDGQPAPPLAGRRKSFTPCSSSART